MENLDNDILKKVEKQKDRVISAMAERSRYLGIYRERVILALTREEVEEKYIYKEVKRALEDRNAIQMTLARTVELKYLKKYMKMAEECDINCKLVDGLSYVGDIALVISAKDAINLKENPIVVSHLEQIRNKGLEDVYYESLGKKISSKYMAIIKEKLPDLADEYEEITFFDKLLGTECPIEKKLGVK
ncbi:DUF1694 domain-containing protein [Oceanivirga salmonicida]|uniref:DUF1694 domain-containing protein n=1 Tax=Oceanivirga salmonicida TaxID=1769291 RepID=UPI000832C067|nr:DUF1694 domain-containing protein [Oceanivirga salmonicida]